MKKEQKKTSCPVELPLTKLSGFAHANCSLLTASASVIGVHNQNGFYDNSSCDTTVPRLEIH